MSREMRKSDGNAAETRQYARDEPYVPAGRTDQDLSAATSRPAGRTAHAAAEQPADGNFGSDRNERTTQAAENDGNGRNRRSVASVRDGINQRSIANDRDGQDQQSDANDRDGQSKRGAWKKAGPPIVAVLLTLVLWQACTVLFEVEPWLLPAPTDIWHETLKTYPRLWTHTVSTLQIAVGGFAAGTACGLLLAVVLHAVPKLREAMYPLIILSQNIPMIALAPLLVVWFGFGWLPKILIIALVCFFPVLVSALQGFAYTDTAMKQYMRMIGANRRQMFRMLEWPSCLPHLFSGLKVSATYSMMGAVVSEWLGAKRGLGMYIQLSQASFETARIFSAIAVIVALSLAFFYGIGFLEKRMVHWNRRKE